MDPQLVEGALALTGERTLPGIWHENYWFRRHEAVYRWLQSRVRDTPTGGIVVDAGCGEGYGAALLAQASGATVVGIDYDAASTAHAKATYSSIQVVRGNLVALPLADRSVAALVSLQTVEHLWDQRAFVAESVRVLRPGGLLAVSTPNRLTFSPGVPRGDKPLNPFHVKELDAEELVALVARDAHVEGVFGLHEGERLRDWRLEHGDVVTGILADPPDAWDPALAGFVAGLTADDFVVSADAVDRPVDHSLDRSLDLVALGRAR